MRTSGGKKSQILRKMYCESWAAQICGLGFIWRMMVMIYQRQQLITLAAPATDLQLSAGEEELSFVAMPW